MNEIHNPSYCAYPWQQMIVDLTGEVVPCCFWSGYGNVGKPLGNTNLNSIEEIWNGSEYQALRRANASNNLEGHPCNRCMAYKWSNGNYPPFSSPESWRNESGHCYLVQIPESFVKLAGNSLVQAELLEDGRPLPFRDSAHADIRSLGSGRYSVWNGWLYFSTSDNSNPSANGRSYELSLPSGRIELQGLDIDSVSGRNILKAQEEYRRGTEVMSAMPTMISIISTADCNIDCPGCSQNMVRLVGVQHRPETVPDILSHVRYLFQFIWHGGEPYLIKRFRQFVDDFQTEDNPNLVFGFTSNGTMLSANELDKLKKFPGINASISMDGFDRESFEKIRMGANYDKVLANVLRAISVYDAPKRVFSVGMIVCKSNFQELPANLEFAIEHDIGLNLSPVLVYPVTEQLNVFEDFELETKGWREALSTAQGVIERAIAEGKPAIRRVDPTGMLAELNSLLDVAAKRYRDCTSLAFAIDDPLGSLSEMRCPGIVLYQQGASDIIAYCKLADGAGKYLIRVPKGYSVSSVWWSLVHDLREVAGRVIEEWLESDEVGGVAEGTFEEIAVREVQVKLPRFAALSRPRNIKFANYGETTPKGLHVKSLDNVDLAYGKLVAAERAMGKGLGPQGCIEALEHFVYRASGAFRRARGR